MGIDLSNIDVTASLVTDELQQSMKLLNSQPSSVSSEDLIKAILFIRDSCHPKNVNELRNRAILLLDGGIKSLYTLLSKDFDEEVTKVILETLCFISTTAGTLNILLIFI